MLAIGSIVSGVRDVARAIDFWTRALDDRVGRHPDETWAILVPRDGPGALLALNLTMSGRPRRHRLMGPRYAIGSKRAWKKRRYFGSWTIRRPFAAARASKQAFTDSATTSMWAWV